MVLSRNLMMSMMCLTKTSRASATLARRRCGRIQCRRGGATSPLGTLSEATEARARELRTTICDEVAIETSRGEGATRVSSRSGRIELGGKTEATRSGTTRTLCARRNRHSRSRMLMNLSIRERLIRRTAHRTLKSTARRLRQRPGPANSVVRGSSGARAILPGDCRLLSLKTRCSRR